MSYEQLKELWYYVIKVNDWDRYLREVYADDEVMYICNSEKEAYEKLDKLAQCLQN